MRKIYDCVLASQAALFLDVHSTVLILFLAENKAPCKLFRRTLAYNSFFTICQQIQFRISFTLV